MKCFHCNSCGAMIFFNNEVCLNCGKALGFLPDVLDLQAIEPLSGEQWKIVGSTSGKPGYRHCANQQQHKACNWMIPESDPNPFCRSCRLDEIIPDLTVAKNRVRWEKLERAKRRCVYTFLSLDLPLERGSQAFEVPLLFRFLEATATTPVLTGHDKGIITLNVAEADDDEREHRRLDLNEQYRTLVGHFRHESGHYFWDRLIANTPHLNRFRELFGDETVNYDQALKNYYQNGPAADWPNRTVSAYASSHPWEDWAETWAHYLHMLDTLETAAGFGMTLNAPNGAGSSTRISPIQFDRHLDFKVLIADWTALTIALNCINRGMGLSDVYPFVVPAPVIEKLKFIHTVLAGLKQSNGHKA